MKGKKQIIILVALAVVSFAVSYLVSGWLSGQKPGPSPQPLAGQTTQEQLGIGGVPTPTLGSVQPVTISMKEQELDRLGKELRLKIDAYRVKQKQLDKQQKQIQLAGQLLEKQAKELEALKMELMTPLNGLKDAMASLENTRIRVAKLEKSNLKRTATIYEKMDAARGVGILIAMYKNNQEDDVVKILFYMSEKKAAKLLAEMQDQNIAAKLCQKLKKIQEDG